MSDISKQILGEAESIPGVGDSDIKPDEFIGMQYPIDDLAEDIYEDDETTEAAVLFSKAVIEFVEARNINLADNRDKVISVARDLAVGSLESMIDYKLKLVPGNGHEV
jgi:hypothetical protein